MELPAGRVCTRVKHIFACVLNDKLLAYYKSLR